MTNKDETNDYLSYFEEFKGIKEIADLIDEVNKLRYYYVNKQYTQMQQHIQKLMHKYCFETLEWNAVNHSMPTTYRQSYINAEMFLRSIGAARLIKYGAKGIEEKMTEGETAFICEIADTKIGNL